MGRLCLYYVREPDADRWIPGDRHWRPLVRRLLRGRPVPSGVDKVFLNLCAGLDRLGIDYVVNRPFARLSDSDRVGVIGRGRHCLDGYAQPNPIVAGVALMTHPSEWPTLCDEYPVVRYLQHSEWAADVYRPYFGDRCTVWPVGIDTDRWRPQSTRAKTVDYLVYDKVHWQRERFEPELIAPIVARLRAAGRSVEVIRYGSYRPAEYADALARSRAMVVLSGHESQGIAYQEAMSAGLPILAWDAGEVLDPERARWGVPHIPSTSTPYFDERCGARFRNAAEFDALFETFDAELGAGGYDPRSYVLERLTLERCSADYVSIVDGAQARSPAVSGAR